MNRGRHAADDGSFARSTGAAAGRGVLLLAIAALIGILLYQGVDDVPPGARVATGGAPAEQADDETDEDATTATTAAPVVTTTIPPLRAPRDVKVLVANGTTIKGLGGQVAGRLRQPAGYNTLAPTNAAAVQASVVHFTPGYEREAGEIAKVLGLPATAVKAMPAPPPVADLRGAHVLVVVGPELAGTGASSGSTTTTARGTTATTARTGASTTSTTAAR